MKISDKIELYYKKNKKIIKKNLSEKKTYNIIFDEKEDNLIHLQNNNETVLTGEYSFYGIYQPNKNIWVWATSIPGIKKNHLKKLLTLKKCLIYSKILIMNSINSITSFYQEI